MRASKSLIVSMLFALSITALAQAPTAPSTHLKVGDPAPDFSLIGHDGKRVSLSEFKGKKNVVLAFYVFAFTGG